MLLKKLIEKGLEVQSKVAETFLGKGDIKYLVLDALNKKEMHGYEIMNSIKKKFLGLYSPSPGTIYPTLQMLEEKEMVKSEKKGKKKVYKITSKGKKALKENKEKITRITKALKKNEVIPQTKKVIKDLKNLGKETIKLMLKSAKQKKKKTKQTRQVLKKTINKIKNIWKE